MAIELLALQAVVIDRAQETFLPPGRLGVTTCPPLVQVHLVHVADRKVELEQLVWCEALQAFICDEVFPEVGRVELEPVLGILLGLHRRERHAQAIHADIACPKDGQFLCF